jgi:hypothetical protein
MKDALKRIPYFQEIFIKIFYSDLTYFFSKIFFSVKFNLGDHTGLLQFNVGRQGGIPTGDLGEEYLDRGRVETKGAL